MRLVSRKIWRAYPQLDRFSDEVCKRYVRHAFHRRNLWKGIVLLVLTLLVAFALSIGAIWYFGYDVMEFFETRRGAALVIIGLVVAVFLGSVIWFPVVSCFIARDLWLRHVIQKQITSTNCPGCEYQLLGLTIERVENASFVTCPECGNRIELNTGYLVEGDIDPHILRCS